MAVEEKGKKNLWLSIKDLAERENISYLEALRKVLPEYSKRLKYK